MGNMAEELNIKLKKNIASSRPPVYGTESSERPRELLLQSANEQSTGQLIMAKLTSLHNSVVMRECEGSNHTSHVTDSIPSYVLWSRSMTELLNNADGEHLFREFLKDEQCENYLDFWYACEGLKNQERTVSELSKFIRSIYKTFIRNNSPNYVRISHNVRSKLEQKIKKKGDLDPMIFSSAQKEIEHHMTESFYPNFMRSDIFLRYVQKVQSGEFPQSGSPKDRKDGSSSDLSSRLLDTVPEEKELEGGEPHRPSSFKWDITSQQWKRCNIPPNFYPDNKSSSGSRQPINPYHVSYVSYAPVSAQDSEIQSFSSGSCTDYSNKSFKVAAEVTKKSRHKKDFYVHEENKGSNLPYFACRMDKAAGSGTLKPAEFAKILTDRLNALKETDSQDILDYHLSHVWNSSREMTPPCKSPGNPPRNFHYDYASGGNTNTINKKLQDMQIKSLSSLNANNHDRIADQALPTRNAAIPTANSKPTSNNKQPTTGQEYTIIGYKYADQAVPYKTKLPGKNITLRQFKTVLHEGGKFRYFFKTVDTMFDNSIINEEITDDDELCPMWDGKIYATIQPAN